MTQGAMLHAKHVLLASLLCNLPGNCHAHVLAAGPTTKSQLAQAHGHSSSSHSSRYAPGAVQAQLNLPRKRVAVAVLASDNSSAEWHDAFAILALSVKKAFATSKFELDLLALTSKAISNKEDTVLKNLGFIVRPLPLPIRADSIQNTFTREEVKKGCCGEIEMLKLHGLTFTEYHRVVVIDGDIMFLHNIDSILDSPFSLAGTYDYELDVSSSKVPMINGGFLVFTPNTTDFQQIVDTVKEGDFRSGTGWKGLDVGWGYGGVGPQGLLAYHYNKETLLAGESMAKKRDLPGQMSEGIKSTRVESLDRSQFDVIDTHPLQEALGNGTAKVGDIRVFHFTGLCEKPWKCKRARSDVCKAMVDKWWELRNECATARGIKASERCKDGGSYMVLPGPETSARQVLVRSDGGVATKGD